MNFIISATTDIGTTKKTNQDSLSMKVIRTPAGRMVFAVLCCAMVWEVFQAEKWQVQRL